MRIALLVVRTTPFWLIAAHRFVEISSGIAAALVLTAIWPGGVGCGRGHSVAVSR